MSQEKDIQQRDDVQEASNSTKDLSPVEASPVEGAERQAHPIASAARTLLQRVEGIEYSLRTLVPSAARGLIEEYKNLIAQLTEAEAQLKSQDPQTQIIGIRRIQTLWLPLHLVRSSEVIETLVRGLFLALFSSFDAYIGDLLTSLYFRSHLSSIS